METFSVIDEFPPLPIYCINEEQASLLPSEVSQFRGISIEVESVLSKKDEHFTDFSRILAQLIQSHCKSHLDYSWQG